MRTTISRAGLSVSLTVMVCTLGPGVSRAQSSIDAPKASAEPTLHVGVEAPPITVDEWIRGEQIDRFEEGRIYVLDFWATWCGPCTRAIPHLTAVQKKHEKDDVHVVGIAIWQPDPGDVAPFVEKQGERLSYRIARDQIPPLPGGVDSDSEEADRFRRSRGVMARTWMKAAGERGIPTVFIVDRAGRVAWIGHPDDLDAPLQKIISGDWDLATARKESAERRRRAVEFEKRWQKIRPVLTTFEAGLIEGRYEEAYRAGAKLVDDLAKDDASTLNRIASWIVGPTTHWKVRDLDLAKRAAERANELHGGENAEALGTLARVQFRRGEIQRAIETQSRAVRHAAESERAEYQSVLDEYRAALEPKDP